MKINIIAAGKIKEKYFIDAVAEYAKRLSRYTTFEITEVPDEKIPDDASEKELTKIKNREGERILSKIKNDSYVIALCVEGKEMSSEEFAKALAKIQLRSSSIVFVIGGSVGLGDEVKRRAQLNLSFGKMTLPHRLMRVVLTEQIYRAFKINNNENYHK